jgi:hypothetical protein
MLLALRDRPLLLVQALSSELVQKAGHSMIVLNELTGKVCN